MKEMKYALLTKEDKKYIVGKKLDRYPDVKLYIEFYSEYEVWGKVKNTEYTDILTLPAEDAKEERYNRGVFSTLFRVELLEKITDHLGYFPSCLVENALRYAVKNDERAVFYYVIDSLLYSEDEYLLMDYTYLILKMGDLPYIQKCKSCLNYTDLSPSKIRKLMLHYAENEYYNAMEYVITMCRKKCSVDLSMKRAEKDHMKDYYNEKYTELRHVTPDVIKKDIYFDTLPDNVRDRTCDYFLYDYLMITDDAARYLIDFRSGQYKHLTKWDFSNIAMSNYRLPYLVSSVYTDDAELIIALLHVFQQIEMPLTGFEFDRMLSNAIYYKKKDIAVFLLNNAEAWGMMSNYESVRDTTALDHDNLYEEEYKTLIDYVKESTLPDITDYELPK